MRFPIHGRILLRVEKAGEGGQREGGHRPPLQLPSKGRMAWNYARAVAEEQLAKARGVPLPSAEEQLARRALCDACEWLRKDDRCAKCGCWKEDKIAWRSTKCPIGKWTAKER